MRFCYNSYVSKICNICKQQKDLTCFSPLTKGLYGRRASCKPCEAEKARIRRQLNPAAHRAAVEKYRKSNPDVMAQRDSRYYAKNREKILEKNKKWRRDNPERSAELNRLKEHRRRARKNRVSVEPYNESQVIDAYGSSCHICGLEIDMDAPRKVGLLGWQKGLQIDHVIALSSGGSDSIENVRPAHGDCNIRKGAS